MRDTGIDVSSLYRVRRGDVNIVDVPELGYVLVDGAGPPDGAEFAAALTALYAVSYSAHFLLKKAFGEAPKVMPLEALWWVDDPKYQSAVEAVARGERTMADVDRNGWRWRALIMQPPPLGEALLTRAVEQVQAKSPSSALGRLRYERWEEGRCAQMLHVGPYAEEAPSIVHLHAAIVSAGYRPRGRHHEIYVGDPRRSAPERLRTILRQPIEQARQS
jgi:hypothetical protein